MEKFHEDLAIANRKLKIADHMINITYPLIRDAKLLISSLENIFLAFTSSMSALLHYERYYKRVPPFNPTFDSKYFLYTSTCQEKFNLDSDHARTMKEIKRIILENKKSPVVFRKNEKYVICSENYKTMVLTHKQTKEFLAKAKLFIQEINSILKWKTR